MPDTFDPSRAKFVFEENSCPGTGPVWTALDKAIEDGLRDNICWACNMNGKNEIIHPKEKT